MTENIPCTPHDLVNFLPYVCYQLQAPFSVVVSTKTLEAYATQGEKPKSALNFVSQGQVSASEKTENAVNLKSTSKADTVFVTAVLNPQGRLIQLDLINSIVPLYFLKIIELCIPFHCNLNKITLRSCPVNDKTIFELSSIVAEFKITELCLDGCPLKNCNCASLLQHQSQLKSLSLNGCELTDEDCKDVAIWLHHSKASCRLRLLSMASNYIKDQGALAIAIMLRSNRSLRYINIANNQITDTGSFAIFNSLMQFSLTEDEIYTQRLHNFEYLKVYRKVYAKFYREALALCREKAVDDRSAARKKLGGKRSTVTLAVSPISYLADGVDSSVAATTATVDLIGPNDNPFSVADTLYKGGQLYSVGNASLAYINISYNNITVRSVVKLIEVLRYQDNLAGGLVRVAMEGNLFPVNSPDLLQLAELQRRAVARVAGVATSDRKNTRKR